ncbi:MAG TPA: hypothetical protein VGL92_19245, partial [Acidimicrobiia bacterium]
ITNPLFPTGTLTQVIQLGDEEGKPARVEATLLPGTKVIDWNGKVETVVRQFIASSDRRIVEVALDYFAQADDGSVWYFGEDVFNYEDGVVADREGSWLAGKDGPAGMIMPAQPKAGDVYRPENIPGLVFEEVTVKAAGETIEGPRGPVAGAVLTREHLMENTFEDKAFAPGYGESRIKAGDEFVQVALAVPTDALPGAPPAELDALSTGAVAIFNAAGAGDWATASDGLGTLTGAWATYQAGEVPKLLGAQTKGALDALTSAVNARNPATARQAAVDLDRAILDLRLRHRPPAAVDLARLGPWALQVQIDAAAGDAGAVAGDVAILETIRDRMAHTLDAAGAEALKASLAQLRRAADGKDVSAAAGAVPALLATLAGLRPV